MSTCEEIKKLGKAIGSDCRYAIVQALIRGPKSVNELVEIVGMTQPAVSQHLKTLKETELVRDERQGQSVMYSLNTEYMLKLLNALAKDVERGSKNTTN
jgi:ArsR family transcriptional regulator